MSMVIFSKQGSGKTRNPELLRKYHNLDVIIDVWNLGDDLPDNALALTNTKCKNSVSLATALKSIAS